MTRCPVLALLLLLLLPPPVAAKDDAAWDIGPYRVTVEHNKDDTHWGETVLAVSRDGRRIHEMRNVSLHVNPIAFFVDLPRGVDYEETIRPYNVGRDVLRIGAPALVIHGHSGGNHSCFYLTILVLSETFEAMPTITLIGSGEFITIRPAPNRTPLTIEFFELPFVSFWQRASPSQSPTARVVLGYDATMKRMPPIRI